MSQPQPPFQSQVQAPQFPPVNPFMNVAPSTPLSTNLATTLSTAGLSHFVPAATTHFPAVPVIEREIHQLKQVDPSESREELQSKIFELESKHSALLAELRLYRLDNQKLLDELNSGDTGLAKARTELEFKLKEQQAVFLEDQKKIKDHLELTSQKYAAEKLKLVSDQVGFAKNAVDQYMLKFDDPNFSGSRGATGESVIESTNKIQESFDNLVTTLEKERDIVGASRVIATETEKLLADVKGLSNRVDDPELKLQLTEGTRNAARMVSKILAETQILSAQGKLTESTLDNLRSCQNVFEQNLAGVRSAIHDQSKSKEAESNLDSLAERELMNAAKIIEDAAASLKVQAALRKSHQQVDGGLVDLDLKGSIAESALFITTSTQRLIMAATTAQQDRVAKGLTSPHDDQMYHSNAMWAEGLISAAKAVANAIKLLVASANKPDGEIDEASLIACTRAVAAHTAKLQSATKAKGEAHSKAVTGVDNAAKQVRDATNALLSEAKTRIGAMTSQAEEDISFNSFGTIKAEMELETNIQRLKARIETANQELFSARKRSYDDSRAAANKGTTTEQPRRTASVSQKSNIDTSSLISPFGHTNSPSRHGLERKSAAGRVDSPSSLNSFGNKDKLEDEESVVLPAYMTKKLEAVIGGGPKIDLTNKPPLEVKPRPIHLQVDLPANLPPSPGTGSDDGKINAATPPRTNNPFTTSKLPSSPFSVGNPFIGK
eukprot:TRINITY_DN5837_c0_g1_i20.p1 TRINITY_DN5837_c0_g1~~TRINITY_DN5837_c0_g1_i20.p1  ORF type:complete len:722 (-),score=184.77 TRINITY_DN5837_c0_g1_i20:92-2257(-)